MSDYSAQCCGKTTCKQYTNHKIGGVRRIVRTNPVIRPIAKMIWDMADAIDKPFYPVYRSEKEWQNRIKSAYQRATRGYSDRDLWNLGCVEAKRLSIMLDALAEEAHGYPAGYGDRSRWLKHHNMSDEEFEQWLDRAAPWQLKHLSFKRTESGYYRSPTVREQGYEFCAWCEDLRYAAKVLRLGCQWCTIDGTRNTLDWGGVFGRNSMDEHYKRVKEQFEITWAWIGRNIGDLWD